VRRFHRMLLPSAAAAFLLASACLYVSDPGDAADDPEGRLTAQDSVTPNSTASDSTDVPADTTQLPPDTPVGALRVVPLLEPDPWAWIPQNDSTLGCPAHEHRGYGLSLSFRWGTPDSVPAPAAYHLYVKLETALYPLIDIWLPDTAYAQIACNAFVIDRNLSGWYWTVEAFDSSAVLVAESEVRRFGFEPCRLASGKPCSAPATEGPRRKPSSTGSR